MANIKTKVFRIDTPNGDYYTLTEIEMHKWFTDKELKEFKDDDQVIFYETKYSVKQLNKARKLHDSEKYCNDFEDEYSIAPEVYDILQHIGGTRWN